MPVLSFLALSSLRAGIKRAFLAVAAESSRAPCTKYFVPVHKINEQINAETNSSLDISQQKSNWNLRKERNEKTVIESK